MRAPAERIHTLEFCANCTDACAGGSDSSTDGADSRTRIGELIGVAHKIRTRGKSAQRTIATVVLPNTSELPAAVTSIAKYRCSSIWGSRYSHRTDNDMTVSMTKV